MPRRSSGAIFNMNMFLFFFTCGILGHSDGYCPTLFTTPPDKIVKPYGMFMRAQPCHRNHKIGAKWLRNCLEFTDVGEELTLPTIEGGSNMIEELLRPIEADEVRKALFQMHLDKSPGPDGMTPGFYQKCWDMVGGDVVTQTYDGMECGYLRTVLLRMGFDGRWVNLIMHCVESVSYTFVHVGRKMGPVLPTRGIRQGDLISPPHLFILCVEDFLALLKKYEVDGKIHGCKVARRAPMISHMLFDDDSYVFCRANTWEADSIMELLHLYELASGQIVFKARYYPNGLFLDANLGNSPSFVWRSVYEAQAIIRVGARKTALSTRINLQALEEAAMVAWGIWKAYNETTPVADQINFNVDRALFNDVSRFGMGCLT
uniref:Reverse transcriptase domain-containing protein n=1 Tax=Cannabis sativa TaxID=3483 RepID=A0A803PW48_CANSA